MKLYKLILLFALFSQLVIAQKADIRGNIYDKATGEPIGFATVALIGTKYGTVSDQNGFFNISGIPAGQYILKANYTGYDSFTFELTLRNGQIVNKQIFLNESTVLINEVNISGKREQARTEVKISTLTVTPKEIKALPSTGGEPDIAQYLQIIPGVISTGDQGGQIYIRGGSPVQNKILLDGMTVFNPFHSIGIFSVFETEIIRSVEVLTGGFGAEYGGRISAIVDLKTKEGDKKKLSGLVSASPFMAKAVIEGPIVKFNDEKASSTSFILSGKHSYIDKTSPSLYKYAVDTGIGKLPFQFSDFYGKISTIASNGSNLNLFGFNFIDKVNYPNLADLSWNASGAGANFKLVPSSSSIIINGTVAYSNYDIALDEVKAEPRQSQIKGLQTNLDFSYFTSNSEVKYGIEFNAFSTDFNFINFLKVPITINSNNTEMAIYGKYRYSTKRLVLDPSLRYQYYASLRKGSIEPRFGLKYNISDRLRYKMAGGLYSQNLMSSVSERDIVNLFVGFITSPDLIYSKHAVAGFEFDLSNQIDLNVETYYKDFTSLYTLNRNKRVVAESDFSKEKGNAYGIDFLLKATFVNWNFWAGYSLGFVNRDDGKQVFPALFDRRHNVNLVANYLFGRNKVWDAGLRWNMGSGFAFTKIQGFFADNKLPNGLNTNFGLDNPDIGIIYSDKINSGRLPYYHRLDFSLKRKIELSKKSYIDIIASVTNAYDRKNIFYYNVVQNRRVNQLPILPSLGVSFHF